MREFVDKEVAYLARFLKVDSLSVPTLTTKVIPITTVHNCIYNLICLQLRSNASINRLTEEFVVKLQTDFSGTISTLFRTGDKLKSTSVASGTNGADGDATCVICHSKIEEITLCSAYSARSFSQTVSRLGPHRSGNALEILDSGRKSCQGGCGDSSSCESNSKLTTCCKQSHALPPKEDWENTLCYGCRVTIQDVVIWIWLNVTFLHLTFPWIDRRNPSACHKWCRMKLSSVYDVKRCENPWNSFYFNVLWCSALKEINSNLCWPIHFRPRKTVSYVMRTWCLRI